MKHILRIFFSFFVIYFVSFSCAFSYQESSGNLKDLSPDIPPSQASGDSWYKGSSKDEAPAATQDKKGLSPDTPVSQEAMDFDAEVSRKAMLKKEDKSLPGGHVKMSGRYRLAAGDNGEDFILNDSNADLQERNFRYLFGERLNNTYDPEIYSQYLLNVDFSPKDKINFHTQLVADPWSWVGTTGEQVQTSDIGGEHIRYNLKYFGAFNSMINEIWRTDNGDALAFPLIKVHDGQTTQTVVHGFNDFNPATHGIPFTLPQLDVDYNFKPIRKLWMDYTEDQWHARVFAFADQSQALSTDDPLELSNHRDYWQHSPWLDQYVPIRFFTDSSVKRGYYSDSLAFLTRDSEGNRLILLRGVSIEAALDKTYFVATAASPYTPWDEKYFASNNVSGAVRIKHQVTDKLMVGGTYTFRTGLVDDSVADWNQVGGVDIRYRINDHTTAKSEVAVSHREKDLLTNQPIKTNTEGYAYKAVLDSNFDHKLNGHTDFQFGFTQMDRNFDPALSKYSNTRDDHFWGKHITFDEWSPDLEYFRLGDGIDRDRLIFHARWKEKLFKDKFVNLIDIRNVHRAENLAYKETVVREEGAYHFTPQLTGKGMFRWQGLPRTTNNLEPFISNFYVPAQTFFDLSTDTFQNVAIKEGLDPSRFTYSGGLQYIVNKQWTAEGIYEYSNDIPDFPRGLLNDVFRDANDRVDGILLDHVTSFLYGQTSFGLPPYKYFNIFKERLIYKPQDSVKIIFHAVQDTYKFASGIDDNITHQGISVQFDINQKWSAFFDFTHSQQIDVPKLIVSNYQFYDFEHHYNFYASSDYKINSSTVFRAEYGVFGMGTNTPQVTPYSSTSFSLPTIDTEHLFRVSLSGDF